MHRFQLNILAASGFFAALLLIALPASGLMAQTPPSAPATEEAETAPAENSAEGDAASETPAEDEAAEPEDSSESIFTVIYKGGWTMVMLGLLSTIIVAFSLERLFYFRRQDVGTDGFFEEVQAALRAGGPEGLAKKLEGDERLIAKILRQGLSARSRGAERVEKEIESAATVEIGKLERGLNLLSNLGNLAPLLGFFGTVVGMRASFLQFVQKAAPTAQDLAGGVEEALITTAAGLLVAIPTYLAYNLFIYYIDNFTMEVERSASAVSGELQ